MRYTGRAIIFFLFFFLLTISVRTEKIDIKDSKSIHICGSSTIMPIVQLVSEEYMKEHPDVIVTVSAGESYRGIKAVIQGTADIGMSASNISEELLKLADSEGVKLADYVIACDGVTPIINRENPVSSISIKQLKKIFSGEITDWKEVGGTDMAVVVSSAGSISGTYEFWKNIVMGSDALITPKAIVNPITSMKSYVSKNKNAIGYISINSLDNSVKPLAVNGIYPSAENIKNKLYPLKRDLKLYTIANPGDRVNLFIKYFNSDKARSIVIKTGNIPVN